VGRTKNAPRVEDPGLTQLIWTFSSICLGFCNWCLLMWKIVLPTRHI